ncbi:hypothetical protein MXZ29_09970 [Streptococcus uberis]|nr:hypothetical protein [Streptococcus uberis]MCK1199127.1 hypothetical protein [Streptococcus uberis]
MNELIKPLAKILDISASELEKIVSSLNMNAPQIYERLLHEWQWYRVLDKISVYSILSAFSLLVAIAFSIIVYFENEKKKNSYINKDDYNPELKVLMSKCIRYLIVSLIVIFGIGLTTSTLRPILAPHIDMIMQLK